MRTLSRSVKRLLRRAGVDISRFQPRTHPVAKKIELWRRLGINLILDVGANAGQFASEVRDLGYTGRIVSFEPLGSAYAALSRRCANDPSWKAVNCAIGNSDGEQAIHVSADSWSSSLLPASQLGVSATPNSRSVNDEKITVRRLDSVFPELHAEGAQTWLKVDTQGYELEVLKGAEATLPKIKMLQLELAFAPLYDGQPLFPEIYEWVLARGFRMGSIELPNWHRETGELLWLDGVFHRITS